MDGDYLRGIRFNQIWSSGIRVAVGVLLGGACGIGACGIRTCLATDPVVVGRLTHAPLTLFGSPVPSSPWYDADQGVLRPVHLEPLDDDSLNRSSRWLPKPKKVPKASKTTTATGSGSGLFGSGLTIWNLLGWLLLLSLFVAAVAVILLGLSKVERHMAGSDAGSMASDDASLDQQTIQRMAQLPSELQHTGLHPRAETKRLMDAGLYDRAIVFLFGHQLLLLDRCGDLRLHRGKTNRRYLTECGAASPDHAARLSQTIQAFERSYFGRHKISEDEFRLLWESNLELERQLDPNAEVAA